MSTTLSNKLILKTRTAVSRALAYLLRKQSYNGGFCFYRYDYLDQPNLRDTYHAVAAIKLSGAEVPRAEGVAQFLNSSDPCDVSGLFYYAFALEQLGRSSLMQEPRLEQIRALSLKRLDPVTGMASDIWLETTLRTLQLQRHFAVLSDAADIVRALDPLRRQGGYGDKANLCDTYLSLSILTLLGATFDSRQDSLCFVDALQKPSIGFTATADSLHTNLPIIGAGMQCCAMLGLSVRYPEDVLSFVLACQSADGSFSRAPVALPDIELTHQALKILYGLMPQLPRAFAGDR